MNAEDEPDSTQDPRSNFTAIQGEVKIARDGVSASTRTAAKNESTKAKADRDSCGVSEDPAANHSDPGAGTVQTSKQAEECAVGDEKGVAKLHALLSKRRKDVFMMRELCKSLRVLPSSVRKVVYPILLGVSNSDVSFSEQISTTEWDPQHQQIIALDVVRTRRTLEFFNDEAVREIMVKLLSFYCKRRGTTYTQGMNEVLAAFINLFVDELSAERSPLEVLEEHQALIFNCFYAFMSRFLVNSFRDDSFRTLKCSLAHFTLLLRFHDPRLANYLEQFDIDPELYTTGWFLTAFAHGTNIRNVERIWDTLIVHDDCTMLHYVAVAIIMHFRDSLLKAQALRAGDGTKSSSRDCVFEALLDMKQRVKSDAEIPMHDICRHAVLMSRCTPRTFNTRIKSVCFSDFEPDDAALAEVQRNNHVFISPNEFILHMSRQSKPSNASNRGPSNPSAPAVKYFVLDCRDQEDYAEECLFMSLNLPRSLLESGESKCNDLVESLQAMIEQGCVFCLLDSDEARHKSLQEHTKQQDLEMMARDDGSNTRQSPASKITKENAAIARGSVAAASFASSTVHQWTMFLAQRGVARCAVVNGGFEACQALAKNVLKKMGQHSWEIFHKRDLEREFQPMPASNSQSKGAVEPGSAFNKAVEPGKELQKFGKVLQLGFLKMKNKFEEITKSIDEEMQKSAARPDKAAAAAAASADATRVRDDFSKQKKKKKKKKKKDKGKKNQSDTSEGNPNLPSEVDSATRLVRTVPLASIMQDHSLKLFKAFLYSRGSRGSPCFLVLRSTSMQCLVTTDQQRGMCAIALEMPYTRLRKMTLKKTNPDLVALHCSEQEEEEEEETGADSAAAAPRIKKYAFLLPERKEEFVHGVQALFKSLQQQHAQTQ